MAINALAGLKVVQYHCQLCHLTSVKTAYSVLSSYPKRIKNLNISTSSFTWVNERYYCSPEHDKIKLKSYLLFLNVKKRYGK